MNAVVCEEKTEWNKETKQTDVEVVLFNYTARARSYTLLATWPEKAGAEMVGNDSGGRKEAMGVWAWKLDTLEPSESTTLSYSLDGLEKGDWNETEILFRGSGDIIGASKLDEKFLAEIRRQESQSEDETEFDEISPGQQTLPVGEVVE